MTVDAQPNLGLASTRELLEELRARGAASDHWLAHRLVTSSADLLDALPDWLLDYRTAAKEALDHHDALARVLEAADAMAEAIERYEGSDWRWGSEKTAMDDAAAQYRSLRHTAEEER